MIDYKKRFLLAVLAALTIFSLYPLVISSYKPKVTFTQQIVENNADEFETATIISTLAVPIKKIVVLDAGHGGYDPGTISSKGVMEKDITLNVALKTGAILEANNIDVVYTRKSDTVSWPANEKQDLATRAEVSNNVKADLFISIHVNSFKLESVKGTETFYSDGSVKGKEAAQLIHSQFVKDTGFVDRGIRGESFSIFRNVKAPTVLLEMGYISNKNEELLLINSSYQQRFSEAIAKGILNYFDTN